MKCSHGLAYEVKCSLCFSEAMARVMSYVNTSGVKNSVPVGQGTGQVNGVQTKVAAVQH